MYHREKKEGLGRAYIAAFKRALQDPYEFIFEMDADFSHDPKYLPGLPRRPWTKGPIWSWGRAGSRGVAR